MGGYMSAAPDGVGDGTSIQNYLTWSEPIQNANEACATAPSCQGSSWDLVVKGARVTGP
jgi:hypothetical protein